MKCLHGGRGSAKSWSFVRALLILAQQRKLFIVCGREFQNSIKESVHKLVSDQIDEFKLNNFFTVKETEVVGINGSRFIFVGIRNNINSIKSMEAVDIFAVFEANNVSKNSWDVLIPTIRRDPPFGPFGKGSEIWAEFNPELSTDETYKRFVLSPPDYCKTIQMNWSDNPFFPQVLVVEKENDYKRDPDEARTIWGGQTRKTLKGAIFAKELEAALTEGRISPTFKADMTKPVTFSFDLGDSDMCAWWAWQQIGMEHNCVDYYGNTGFGFDHFADEILSRRHKVGKILLPHDAAQAHQSARGHKLGNTIEKQARAVFEDKVRLVPRVSIVNRINAARNLFPRINFAEGPTSDGVQGLTHYQYKVDEKNQRSKEPLHNWASNPADAFTYYAVWLKEGSQERSKPRTEFDVPQRSSFQSGQSWMG